MAKPQNSISMNCITMPPPKVNSRGIWDHDDPMLTYALPLLQLQMVLVFCVTEVSHFILKRLNLPKFVSQIIAGIILGPQILGRSEEMKRAIFPMESHNTIDIIGLFSYTLFAFMAGVKIDVSMINATGKVPFSTGILSFLAPFVIGVPVLFHKITVHFSLTEKEIISLGILTFFFSTSTFPNTVVMLEELKLINSELGRLSLSSSVITTMLSFLCIIGATAIRISRDSILKGLTSFTGTLFFALSAPLIIRPMMFWIIKQTPEGRPVKKVYIYSTLILVFGSGLLTKALGHAVTIGPFILGMVVPDGPPLGSAFVEKFDGFCSGILLPFFVSTIAMKLDLTHINSNLMATSTIIVSLILVIKLVACLVPLLASKMPLNDALSISLVLIPKGVPDLAWFSALSASPLVVKEALAIVPLTSLFTFTLVPLLVNLLYDPSRKYRIYQKRNIMHSKNAELKILACVYRKDNVRNIMNLLDTSTRETFIHADVLHLIELVGRSSPMFISHQLQKSAVSKHSYSENVINAFAQYDKVNYDSVTVNIFTSITPRILMHEDICSLALTKQASLILLPFHRTWALDGCIETEDSSKRIVNCSILEKAPCSVAILIDHCYNNFRGTRPSYNVCVIFLGGNDDREALTLAKRMIKNSKVNLTVLRLIPKNDDGETNWDKMLDSEELKDVKPGEGNEDKQVRYIEEEVQDGGDTATTIQSLRNEFDIFIVGRRYGINSPQTSGLSEWSEFPELGALGDLLASSDMNAKGLILVVQQQIIGT